MNNETMSCICDTTIKKSDVLFITARGRYATDSIIGSGYELIRPYKGKGIVARVLREICFKLKFFESRWFVTPVKKYKYIIVQDSLITHNYLVWLLKHITKETKVIFQYQNMVGAARNLKPNEIPDQILACTYDDFDSKKYGLSIFHSGGYYEGFVMKKQKKTIDVFYVGRDKGRSNDLLNLKNLFDNMGLKNMFVIVKDGVLSKRKSFYSKPMSYYEVVDYISRSKAILNVTMPNQKGKTMRDLEALFNNVKLITDNKFAKEFDFYNKNDVFIIGEDDLHDIPKFIDSAYEDISEEIKYKNTFDYMIKEIVEMSEQQ